MSFRLNGIGTIGRKPLGRMQTPPIGIPCYLPVPPRPPGNNYSIPTPDVTVSNVTDLATQVTSGTPKIIKVNNGSYARASELVAGAAHKIYCETFDGVTFDFGFRFNYIIGWEFHGGVFNITDASRAAADGGIKAALISWFSSGSDWLIEDIQVDGSSSRVLTTCLSMGSPTGGTVRRCILKNATDFGLHISDNNPSSSNSISEIADLDISNIFRSTRGQSDGTAEAGLMVGNKVTKGIHRIRVRNTGWQGLAPNNAFEQTQVTDIDIDVIYGVVPPTGDDTGTGLYWERFCNDITLERFRIGPDLFTAINAEWNLGAGVGAAQRCDIKNGVVRATRSGTGTVNTGIYFDEGSDQNTVRGVHFLQDCDWACIGYYLNTNTSAASFTRNNYHGRAAGSVRGTTNHAGDPSPTETL